MVVFILHWFILAVIFLYSYLPSVHQPSLGVYRGNAWSAAIGRRGWPQEKMRFLPSDWPKQSRCLGWVSGRRTNRIQTSVPSREENRGGVSGFVQCNLTAPESRQPNPGLLSLRTGYTELSVIIVGFYFKKQSFCSLLAARRHDSRAPPPVGRVGRISTGRVVCIFSGAIWRRGWAHSHEILAVF